MAATPVRPGAMGKEEEEGFGIVELETGRVEVGTGLRREEEDCVGCNG